MCIRVYVCVCASVCVSSLCLNVFFAASLFISAICYQARKFYVCVSNSLKKKTKEKNKICIESEMFLLPILLVKEHSIPSEIFMPYTKYEIIVIEFNRKRNLKAEHISLLTAKQLYGLNDFALFFKGKNERKKKDDADIVNRNDC